MRYSPKNENTRPLMITILLTVIAVFSILFAGHFQNLKWLFQLSFLCFATAAIQIFLKYVLTKYEYLCDETSLSIYKIMGRRKQCVGVMDFKFFNSNIYKVHKNQSARDLYDGTDSVLIFTRNLKSDDVYGFKYNYNSTNVYIELEADDAFISYINEKISNSQKGNLENDEF